MGIYIKGMEMPTSCYECPLQDDECFGSIKCQYAKTWGSARMRAVDCPLIPVPPHGRLIDADALYKDLLEDVGYGEAERFNDYWLGEQPTIVPEEEEE